MPLIALGAAALAQAGTLDAIVAGLPSRPVERPPFATERPTTVVVVDAQGLDYDRNLTLLALQGLVNRRAPRLYVVGMNAFNRDADLWWVERLKSRFGVQVEPADFPAAVGRFAPELQGAIVYPVDGAQSENVACMVGSLLNLLPVTADVQDEIGLPVRFDLTGCFASRLEAMGWAAEHLAPSLQPRDLACLDDRNWLLVRDYALMRGAFIGGLSTVDQAEAALRGRIADMLPAGSIQWGWVCRDGEGDHVEHGSRHGLRTLCSTNSPNLSFFSRLRPLQATLPKRPAPPPMRPESKVYLAFVLSDGDSIPILQTRQWYRWDERARGTVPFGWEMQPLFVQIAPAVLEYYYETASDNDEFIQGPSGAGYVHPSSLPDPSGFFEDTRRGVRELSAPVVGVLDNGLDAGIAALISKGVPNAAGFFHGWGGSPHTRPIFADEKVHLAYRLCPPEPKGRKDEAYYAAFAREIRRLAEVDGLPCCLPIHLSCYWSGPDDVPRILEALGEDLPVEVVLPSQLVRLAERVYRERIFLTVPEEVRAMAGLAYTLPVSLESTRSKPSDLHVVVAPAAALDGMTTLQLRLPANDRREAALRLRLPDPSRESDLRVTVLDGRAVVAQRTVGLAPIPAPAGLPAGFDTLQSVWEAEALAHGNGHAIDDPQAHNGKAWASVEGTDQPEGTTIWGQYEPLEAGSYAVAFRCRTSTVGETTLARLDAFAYDRSRQGLDGTLAQRTVSPADLPADGAYGDVWLSFTLTEPAKVEYRVAWTGRGEVVTDRIVVVRGGGAAP
jgi:hypothetical protein